MTRDELVQRFRTLASETVPFPGCGETAERHRRLMEAGREDLSLARLIEAHWDAVAILAEAGRTPETGQTYGVWAAEKPGEAVVFTRVDTELVLQGIKPFCSGAGIVDRALITALGPEARLIEVDLRANAAAITYDDGAWKSPAFAHTRTAITTFRGAHVSADALIGDAGWYLSRPGFWHGACGPAACWAGGAVGLVDYALRQRRRDPHTLAHLGALQADAWALAAYLERAGAEIDAHPTNAVAARVLARTVRHLVEQACTDVLQRLGRAYGPHPLAMDAEVSQRYAELELYLRQCHAERDLAALGEDMFPA